MSGHWSQFEVSSGKKAGKTKTVLYKVPYNECNTNTYTHL